MQVMTLAPPLLKNTLKPYVLAIYFVRVFLREGGGLVCKPQLSATDQFLFSDAI